MSLSRDCLDEREHEVRLKLLEYYSAKTSSQGINGLNLSLIFFTFIIVINGQNSIFGSKILYALVLSLIFAVFVTLFLRIGHRLLLWSNKSEAIKYVKMATGEELLETMEKSTIPHMKNFGKNLFEYGKSSKELPMKIELIGVERGEKGLIKPKSTVLPGSNSMLMRLEMSCNAWQAAYQKTDKWSVFGLVYRIGKRPWWVFAISFFILLLLLAFSVGTLSFHNGFISIILN